MEYIKIIIQIEYKNIKPYWFKFRLV